MARAASQPPDLEFLRALSAAVTRFLRSIDAWEESYRRVYRMPGPSKRLPPELSSLHSEYVAAYELLRSMTPRARRLCNAHEVRDVWPALIRVEPKLDAPQFRFENAIGRNERLAVAKCISELMAKCGESTVAADPPRRKSPLKKFIDYFY